MRYAWKITFFMLAFVCAASAQRVASMNEVLSASPEEITEAKNQGFEVFRLAPRGMFDEKRNELSLRGGGAYYSFATKSHSYNETPQIELQKDSLSVAFYGANYGFITDLGETPLENVDKENKRVAYLLGYQPKKIEREAREEYRKIGTGFETDGLKFNQRAAAKVGHVYLLRAISFDEADTLVAFKVQARRPDGSLTIFWKAVADFEKPILVRDDRTAQSEKANFVSVNYGGGRAAKVQDALRKKGFTDVKVEQENEMIVLRGKYPKGKLSEVIQTAQEANEGKPLRNELTEF